MPPDWKGRAVGKINPVTPAQAGAQCNQVARGAKMGPRLRRDDRGTSGDIRTQKVLKFMR